MAKLLFSVHNLKKKRETNRMKWVRVSLSLCYFSLAFDRLVRDDGTKNRHYPGLPYRGFGDWLPNPHPMVLNENRAHVEKTRTMPRWAMGGKPTKGGAHLDISLFTSTVAFTHSWMPLLYKSSMSRSWRILLNSARWNVRGNGSVSLKFLSRPLDSCMTTGQRVSP